MKFWVLLGFVAICVSATSDGKGAPHQTEGAVETEKTHHETANKMLAGDSLKEQEKQESATLSQKKNRKRNKDKNKQKALKKGQHVSEKQLDHSSGMEQDNLIRVTQNPPKVRVQKTNRDGGEIQPQEGTGSRDRTGRNKNRRNKPSKKGYRKKSPKKYSKDQHGMKKYLQKKRTMADKRKEKKEKN